MEQEQAPVQEAPKKVPETPKELANEFLEYCKIRANTRREYLEMVLLCGECLELDLLMNGFGLSRKKKDSVLLKAEYLQRYARQALGLSKKTAKEAIAAQRAALALKDWSLFDPMRDL